MDGHPIRATDVSGDELLPRVRTLEHHIRTARGCSLLYLDCEGKELPADADQRCGNSPVHWRVNPAFWLTV